MDAFTPYYDKMYSVLEGLSLKALENCNGKDTASRLKAKNNLGYARCLRRKAMTFPCLYHTGMKTSQRSAGWLILCPQLMILLTKFTAPNI